MEDNFPDTPMPSAMDITEAAYCTDTDVIEVKSAPPPPPSPVLPLIHQFPHQIHKYIENIIGVQPDGNCGYRSIAALLGMSEDSWPLIRQDLITELRQNRDDYVRVLGGDEYVDELTRSLYLENVGRCRSDKWMTTPDAGYVIANKYKVVVICLESRGSYTIFPLRHAPPRDRNTHRVICIGYIHSMRHFVQVRHVYFKNDAPIPPSDRVWETCRSDKARE